MRQKDVTRLPRQRITALLAVALMFAAAITEAREDQKFVVYGDRSLPPYEFLRDGVPQGAMVDLVHVLAQRMGRTPEIVLQKWNESQEAVLTRAGGALSIMARTREREEKYDFSDETFHSTFSLFVLADGAESYDTGDLAGVRIGVTQGGLSQSFLSANHPEAKLVVVDDTVDGVRRVLRREIDALAANTWAARYFLSEMNISGVSVVTPPLHTAPSAMAIPKGNPQLVAEINAALRELRQDGTLDRIIDKWSSEKVYVLSHSELSRATLLALAGGLLLMFTAGGFWLFRRQRNALRAEVSQHLRTEAALRESEEKYRSLFSNMNEGFALGELIYDAEGKPTDFRLSEANDAFYRQAALPRDILNRPARDYIPDLEQHWLDAYHSVVTTGVSTRLKNTNGRRNFDLCAFRLSPGRFAFVFRDITESVQNEKALRETERDLRELIATLPGMVWICKADGAVEFMSRQWSEYTGLSLESQLGDGAFDRIHPDDRAHVATLWREAISTCAPFHVEYRLRRHDGAYRWFKSRGTALYDDDGKVTRWLGVIVDIDDRKQVEQALETARAEAERANSAKSRFLAAASHDLRQPLGALMLYVKVLKDGVARQHVPLVDNIEGCAAALKELLTDLLDVSKLDAGVVKPTMANFPLADMLGGVATVLGPEAQHKGLSLRCARTTLFGYSDALLYRRIISNLVSNAIRYTESGGALVGVRRHGGKRWVEVWDTGGGIPADKTRVIFEEFVQLGDSRTRGSGLGLAIVAKIAGLLGLEIRVRSLVGKGSMFAIELPVGSREVPVTLQEGPAPSAVLGIAVVDDNAVMLDALARTLKNSGHQVVAALSGTQLLDKLAGVRPDVLISDYRLADGETGFDVMRAVNHAFDEDIPAIMLTGDTDPELIASLSQCGILLQHKPVDFEELQACLIKATTLRGETIFS